MFTFNPKIVLATLASAAFLGGCGADQGNPEESRVTFALGEAFEGNWVRIKGGRDPVADSKYPCVSTVDDCFSLTGNGDGGTCTLTNLCPSRDFSKEGKTGAWHFEYTIFYNEETCRQSITPMDNISCEPTANEWLQDSSEMLVVHNHVNCITHNTNKDWNFCIVDPATGATTGKNCPTLPPSPAPSCETGYALGNTTFIELGLTTDRWGWEEGPLGPGTYVNDIYTGAAQNDLSKGTLVGTETVVYDGSSVTVSYQMNGSYLLLATHVYVGTSHVATISPGQYGNTHDPLYNETSDAFTVGGFNGEPIYVVAHARVCR